MQDWELLTKLTNDLNASEQHELPDALETILSERILAALSSDQRDEIDDAIDKLEQFYLARLAAAPASAGQAARGNGDPASAEVASFSLGQIGFAHAVLAFAASRRADARFERVVLDRKFESYIRLLLDRELSGRELADEVGKDPAEVSRKLKLLRQIGAVEHRRNGNKVINFLTPAARAVAREKNMGPKRFGKREFSERKVAAIASARDQLEPHLQQLPNFAPETPDERRVVGGW